MSVFTNNACKYVFLHDSWAGSTSCSYTAPPLRNYLCQMLGVISPIIHLSVLIFSHFGLFFLSPRFHSGLVAYFCIELVHLHFSFLFFDGEDSFFRWHDRKEIRSIQFSSAAKEMMANVDKKSQAEKKIFNNFSGKPLQIPSTLIFLRSVYMF